MSWNAPRQRRKARLQMKSRRLLLIFYNAFRRLEPMPRLAANTKAAILRVLRRFPSDRRAYVASVAIPLGRRNFAADCGTEG